MPAPRIGAGLSTATAAAEAAREAAAAARASLAGEGAADLAVVFASREHLGAAEDLLAAVDDVLAPGELVGCCAQGVVGGAREIEEGPALSVWAASLPDASVATAHVTAEIDTAAETIEIAGLPDPTGADAMLLLTDPYTFPADALLDALAADAAGFPVIGGLASGGAERGDDVLFLDDRCLDEGAVAVLLGGVDIVPCVSQGAAPIGPEVVVTGAEGNVVHELASKPALEKLNELIAEVGPRERALAATGLLLGIVIDENQPEYERGDFLIRGLLGADPESGSLVVGDQVRVGQTVRLHVRDAQSADEDLRESLAGRLSALEGRPTAGALLFTCNGRGRHMFPVADHDAGALAESLAGAPVAGFFCAGEIGPVGGRSFLHGFTATMAVFPG